MLQRTDRARPTSLPTAGKTIRLASRNEISQSPHWQTAFARERKDHRYYELVEDTLKDGFTYGYFAVESGGAVCAIQPYFIVDQDLLAGIGGPVQDLIAGIRRHWPRFMRAHTLMVGCSAGEGHLDGDDAARVATAELFADALPGLARKLGCAMVVLKEFPADCRPALQCLRAAGFTRIPSMPMTTLAIDYKNFDDYVSSALSPATRGKLRRKLRAAERARPPITMSVVDDVSAVVDEIYPLYEKVFERSSMHFEKLTKDFLCEIGRRIPDKARFFMWRQDARIVAFGLCMVQDDGIWSEYVGFDYAVAFELNLYYRVFHDTIAWAIANGYKRFYSTSLNYDPKWHLRQSLYPVDLYVRHTSAPINALLRRLLPLLEPTHTDKILPHFHNYGDLWH
ncbi:MAG TPA: GNAT family N-acetyltransferase [Pseudolabrys sp.]|jgi:hypothetical protein|nr:GNAT family N-acetyltransferase [Pseudolabrys sp.]